MAINTENIPDRKVSERKIPGLLALSPLLVFLIVYAVSSVIARDFYKVPIAAAFIIATCWALLITKGVTGTDSKISIFSRGAGNPNVMLMIWIFVLAGAFAATAKDIGAIDATVAFALDVLPGKLIYAGLFLAACFISMAVGTSVGTIVALVPVAVGIAAETGAKIPYMTAIVVGGAFFGDNLSFISDTTIAATKMLGCSMRDKFRANLWIALPAALAVTAIYVFQGFGAGTEIQAGEYHLLKLVPYLFVIVAAIAGMNVVTVLAAGIGVNAIIGFATGAYGWIGWMGAIGTGITNMGELIIVTLLAGGMLELIRYNGGLQYVTDLASRGVKSRRGAFLSIAGIVSLANLCTANNTVAIITTGGMAKEITDRFGLDPKRSASILDTFSCLVQGVLPYGAQMLMASGLAGVSAISIMGYLYYPFTLGAVALLSILFTKGKTQQAR